MSCMHVASTCLVETRQKKHDNVKTSKNKNSLGTDTMKFTTAKGKLLPPHVPPCGCCGKAGEATKFQKTQLAAWAKKKRLHLCKPNSVWIFGEKGNR